MSSTIYRPRATCARLLGLLVLLGVAGCYTSFIVGEDDAGGGDAGACDAGTSCDPPHQDAGRPDGGLADGGSIADAGPPFDAGPPLPPPTLPPIPTDPDALESLYCAAPASHYAGILGIPGDAPTVSVNMNDTSPPYAVDHHDGSRWTRVHENFRRLRGKDVFFVAPSTFYQSPMGCALAELGPGTTYRCVGSGGSSSISTPPSAHIRLSTDQRWIVSERQLFTWNGSFFEFLDEVPAHPTSPRQMARVHDDLEGAPVLSRGNLVFVRGDGGLEALIGSVTPYSPVVDICTRRGQIWTLRENGEVWAWRGGDWEMPWSLPEGEPLSMACNDAGVAVASSQQAYASWRGWAALANFGAADAAIEVQDVEAYDPGSAVLLLEGARLTSPGCGPLRVLVVDADGARWK